MIDECWHTAKCASGWLALWRPAEFILLSMIGNIVYDNRLRTQLPQTA